MRCMDNVTGLAGVSYGLACRGLRLERLSREECRDGLTSRYDSPGGASCHVAMQSHGLPQGFRTDRPQWLDVLLLMRVLAAGWRQPWPAAPHWAGNRQSWVRVFSPLSGSRLGSDARRHLREGVSLIHPPLRHKQRNARYQQKPTIVAQIAHRSLWPDPGKYYSGLPCRPRTHHHAPSGARPR